MITAFSGRHAMVSFAHPDQVYTAAEICQSVVLDNGAFSAWSSGAKLDIEGFFIWAEMWLRHPAVEWALIPDVIDGDEVDNDALLHLAPFNRRGYVPVWHLHESLERLDRLVGEWPRVALGSSGEYKDPGSQRWWSRMAEAMGVACDANGMPRTKLHGLRMLDPVIFSHLPLASADSCNVARNVGLDVRWSGAYAPRSRAMRALIIMDRIESHAAARSWNPKGAGVQQNMELLG